MEHPPRSAATPRSSWPRTATPAGACRPIWARTQTPAVRSAPRPGPPCATAARHRLRPGRGRFGHVILVRGQRAAKPGPDGDGAEATGTQQANPDCGCTGGDEVGCQCGADDERQGLGEGGERVGRPRIVLSVRRLTSGPVVGASTVSPSPKSGEAEHEGSSADGRGRQRGEAEHRPGDCEDQPADGKGAASPGSPDEAQHEQLGEHDEGRVDGER